MGGGRWVNEIGDVCLQVFLYIYWIYCENIEKSKKNLNRQCHKIDNLT